MVKVLLHYMLNARCTGLAVAGMVQYSGGSCVSSRSRSCIVSKCIRVCKLVLLHSVSKVTQQADMSLPMYWDRRETPLPDRPYNDALTAAEKSLKQKEKGPWNNLTQEEKLACLYFILTVMSGSRYLPYLLFLMCYCLHTHTQRSLRHPVYVWVFIHAHKCRLSYRSIGIYIHTEYRYAQIDSLGL